MRDKMRSNTKMLNRNEYFWLQCDGEEAKLRRHWLPIAATESVATGLTEREPMTPFRNVYVSGNLVPAQRVCRLHAAENPRAK